MNGYIKKVHVIIWLFCILGLFMYFFIAHPLILSDADDWYNASYWRRPLPIFAYFGGIKVLPETFMALCSMVAVNFILPFTGNYLRSLALVYALAITTMIGLYVYLTGKLVRAMFKSSVLLSDALSIIFLLMHFLMYKNDVTGCTHLLWSWDITCLFHYTFSTLLNASLVLFFVRKESVENKDISSELWEGKLGFFNGGVLLFLIYLSVFSNMFSNIIFVSYAGVHALRKFYVLWRANNKKETSVIVRSWVADSWLFILTDVLWIIAIFIQMSDPRNNIAREHGAKGSLSGAIYVFVTNFTSINKMAILVIALVFFCMVGKRVFQKRRKLQDFDSCFTLLGQVSYEIIASAIITAAYLIVLCGVASPSYLARNDVKLGIFFFALIEFILIFGWACTSCNTTAKTGDSDGRLVLLVPLILFVVMSQSLNYCKSYRDFNMVGLSVEEEIRIAEDIISQFESADELGLDTFELHVIKAGAGDNWPYPDYSGNLIGDTLFRHGIISRKIVATTVFDQEKNIELRIDF